MAYSSLINSVIYCGISPIPSNKIHRTSSLVSYKSVTETALTSYVNWLRCNVSSIHLSLLFSYRKIAYYNLTNSKIYQRNSSTSSSKNRRISSSIPYPSVTATASCSYTNWLCCNVSNMHLSLPFFHWKLAYSIRTNSFLYQYYSSVPTLKQCREWELAEGLLTQHMQGSVTQTMTL